MSTRRGGQSKGAPKHQNAVVWKPNSGVKKNESELGGKFRPFSAITGVCPRCKQQIEWRRKYGKYKALTEPAKCHDCGKRAVRQAYHALCSECAKKRNVCAKCCNPAPTIIGSNVEEEEQERKQLEEALKTMRERDRRTLLRNMEGGARGAALARRPDTKAQQDEGVDSEDDLEVEDEEDEGDEGGEDINTHSEILVEDK